VEVEDTYLRLDQDIADFLAHLDKKLGAGNYLFFLTADHGVAHIPALMNEHNMPAGTFNDNDIAREINIAIENEFGIKKGVRTVMNYQVYLNTDSIESNGKDVEAVKRLVRKMQKQKP
jgi:hypothetical protein